MTNFILEISDPQDATLHLNQWEGETDDEFVTRSMEAVGKFSYVATICDTTLCPVGDISGGKMIRIESPYFHPDRSRVTGSAEEAMMRLLAAMNQVLAGRIHATQFANV